MSEREANQSLSTWAEQEAQTRKEWQDKLGKAPKVFTSRKKTTLLQKVLKFLSGK